MLSQSGSKLCTEGTPPIECWKWRVLTLTSAAFFLVVLDFSIVNVAMAAIQADLGFSPTALQWVATAYALTFGGFLLLGGRCADLMGRRRVMLFGVSLFTASSFLAGISGLSHSHPQAFLVVCRGLQGLGGAFIAPAALAIVNTTFCEGAERNRALGILCSIATSGLACGNLFGGVLTGHFGWPAVFFANVPLGFFLLVLAPRLIKSANENNEPLLASIRNLDIAGAITVTGGLIALVYAAVTAEANGLRAPSTLLTLGVACALLLSFLYIEATVARPMMPLSIFKHPRFAAANILMLIIEGLSCTTFLLMSLYLQQVRAMTPQSTGFSFLPLAVWMSVTANLTPRLINCMGTKSVLIAGAALTSLSLSLLSRLSETSSYLLEVQPVLFLAGVGMAAAVTTSFIVATTGLADEDQGLASGIIQTSQQVGAALCLAVLVAVAGAHSEAARITGASPTVAQLAGLGVAFRVAGGLAGFGGLVALFALPAMPPRVSLSHG